MVVNCEGPWKIMMRNSQRQQTTNGLQKIIKQLKPKVNQKPFYKTNIFSWKIKKLQKYFDLRKIKKKKKWNFKNKNPRKVKSVFYDTLNKFLAQEARQKSNISERRSKSWRERTYLFATRPTVSLCDLSGVISHQKWI